MRAAVLMLTLVLASCGGTLPDLGADAMAQVGAAQFFRGVFPKAAAGPSVGSLRMVSQTLRVGQTNRQLTGSVANSATSIAIALDGDPGYWVRPVGGADAILTDQLGFDATLGFSRFVPAGDHDLLVAASDANGHFGETEKLRLSFIDPNAPKPGALRVTLSWDTNADLDLHVIQPDGKEIWARKITSYEPPVVGPIDQTSADAAGHLDFDSNSMCRVDGRNLESVLFDDAAPSGHYVVRVDAFSLCGAEFAHWKLSVEAAGVALVSATGTALPSATRFSHERGAGVLAAEFAVP